MHNAIRIVTTVVLGVGTAATAGEASEPSFDPRRFTPQDFVTAEPSAGFAPDSDYLDVPGGFRIHPSCIHEVPPGSMVAAHRLYSADGTFVRKFPKCRFKPKRNLPPPTVNGWILASMQGPASTPWYINPPPLPWFTRIVTQWTVPNPPALCGFSIKYFFNALQGTGGGAPGTILQPVLEHRPWPACDMRMTNYMVSDDGSAYTGQSQLVGTGTLVEGYVKKHDSYSCGWGPTGEWCTWRVGYRLNWQAQEYETVFMSPSRMHDAVGSAAEAYGVNFCEEWPRPPSGPLTFATVSLRQATISSWYTSQFWSPPFSMNAVNFSAGVSPSCGYNVSVFNNGDLSSTASLTY